MTTVLSRTTASELPNGIRLYVIPTLCADIVTFLLALPGGTHATYERQSLALLHAELLPGSTAKRARSAVRERFDALGCRVSVSSDAKHLIASLSCRKAVFPAALELLVETLTAPSFPQAEVREGRDRLVSALEQSREDTRTRAHTALMHALYRTGHPHWSPDLPGLIRELGVLTRRDVDAFHTRTIHTTGTFAVVAGDVKAAEVERLCAKLFSRFARGEETVDTSDTRRLVSAPVKDVTVQLADKINIDTYLGLPISITRSHADFEALSAGVAILGGSHSSRMFHILRNEMSLTYHASARLAGFGDGYPGYLLAYTILPHDVFTRGREALRTVVSDFIEKGVTAKELTARKQEIAGRHVVGLSTTGGLAGAVFGTLQSGLPLSYVDEYPERMGALTLREVNDAIHTHLNSQCAVTAAAGTIG